MQMLDKILRLDLLYILKKIIIVIIYDDFSKIINIEITLKQQKNPFLYKKINLKCL